MTTAQPSVAAVCHTRAASAGTGRALRRHRVRASTPVNASTAGLPSFPISVGSTISLFLSPSAAEPSARTATTGTSSRAAARAASAACSLPRPAW
jgi:hypothetical protein